MTDFPAFMGGQLLTAAVEAVAKGEPHRAIAFFEDEIGRGIDDPTTLGNYGVLLWRVYEIDRADAVFARVVARPDSDPETLRRVARCYFEIGRFARAAEVMRAAAERTAAPDAQTLNTLAWTLERDNQISAAREQADAA
jgi:Tfp pilus assembly protein PilF